VPPTDYTAAGRAAAIEDIRQTPVAVREAVRGLSTSAMLTPYREGGWTVAQVVHHIADAHVNAFVRFKWTLTEDRPTIKVYNQARWAELPDATGADVEDSLQAIDAVHARWVRLLDAMTPADFAREFVHPDRGPQTIDRNVAMYAWHGRHHVAHITSLRQRMHW
jgi:uncharacterized damage-inducible protein DinB